MCLSQILPIGSTRIETSRILLWKLNVVDQKEYIALEVSPNRPPKDLDFRGYLSFPKSLANCLGASKTLKCRAVWTQPHTTPRLTNSLYIPPQCSFALHGHVFNVLQEIGKPQNNNKYEELFIAAVSVSSFAIYNRYQPAMVGTCSSGRPAGPPQPACSNLLSHPPI